MWFFFSNCCVDTADYLSPNNSNENRNSIWPFIRTTVSSIQLSVEYMDFPNIHAWHRFPIINLQLVAAAASTPSTRAVRSYLFHLFKCSGLNGRNQLFLLLLLTNYFQCCGGGFSVLTSKTSFYRFLFVNDSIENSFCQQNTHIPYVLVKYT